MFRFRLEPVLKFRRYRRDIVRALLAGVIEDARKVEDGLSVLSQDRSESVGRLRDMSAGGRFDVDQAASLRYYCSQLSAQIMANRRQKELVENQLRQVQAALVLADREVKTLEKLKERQRAEFDKRSQRIDDRVATDQWNGVAATGSTSTGVTADSLRLGR
ncbi:flagellar export protein FliJ [Stratiformator vulcanicus]|uniref:Flagellar FliJ protein n=1 Tax=Stratiformator vulcanicus TaxID=2527980 RepID=A0A517R586_9PLAN|nr:flagellar FliJ family protein [Stratiformator vulcanicus]QDT39057.1 Flagellar FliJ protein [Stratiformator vulcanicus]